MSRVPPLVLLRSSGVLPQPPLQVSLALGHLRGCSSAAEPEQKPFYKRFLPGRGKKEEKQEEEEEEAYLYQEEEKANLEMEKEELRRQLRRNQNRSRLRASDRRMLHRLPPLEGVAWERNDWQRSKENKVSVLGNLYRVIDP